MTTTTAASVGSLADLLDGWELHLRAEAKSPKTVAGYLQAANQLVAFLEERGMPTEATSISREHVESFVVDLLERWKPATASNRFRALQQLFKWLHDEGEIAVNPMARMNPPKVDEALVPVITDDELRALFKDCDGSRFEDRRDLAMMRLLLDSGMRAAELIGLSTADIDVRNGECVVLGKGRRPRVCSFGAKTAAALERYVRLRKRHPQRDTTDAFWIGQKGTMTDSGLRQMLERRGARAGVADLHAHRFRHTFTHLHKVAGASDGDLMMMGGWRSPQMLQRYGASAAAERARETHRRLAIGDRF